VPGNGYVLLRFKTHSANLLFFHCHFDFHLQAGMAGILQVGELKDLPKPPENFPQCRNFVPKV
jgi:L-ascorbate oxidase